MLISRGKCLSAILKKSVSHPMPVAIRRHAVISGTAMFDDEVERLSRILVPLHVLPLKLVVHASEIVVLEETRQELGCPPDRMLR